MVSGGTLFFLKHGITALILINAHIQIILMLFRQFVKIASANSILKVSTSSYPRNTRYESFKISLPT